jgi:hypothetical protein
MTANQSNPNVEVWKVVSDFSGYEVSDHGQVRSFWRNNGRHGYLLEINPVRILKPVTDKGYLFVSLHKNGKQYKKPIHQLVLIAFVGKRPPKYEACHNDGKPNHNHVNNLRWDTSRNNQLDKWKHGTMNNGENQHSAKLTIQQVQKIRVLHKIGVSQYELAKRFGVHQSCIRSVVNRKTWAHII